MYARMIASPGNRNKIGDKKCLDPLLISLSYSQFDMPLNDSSLVFHPVHVIDLSWAQEEHCLDFEGFGKSPVDEVFGSSAVNESLFLSRSA
jgi:hypothetical protein